MPEQDDYEQIVIDNIAKYGCHLVMIEADNYLPAFVYSIGLYENFGHPEIICFGLNIDTMGHLINDIRDEARQGKHVEADKSYPDYIENFDIRFLDVDKAYYKDYLGYASWFYKGKDYPMLQMVWPDKRNKFPWEDGFNEDWKFKQPLLDRGADFKFYEERTLAAYTTKQAFNGEPILYVYHNDDGDWQFHTSDDADLNDAILVSLEQMVKLDSSLNDIYHLQYGWHAWRHSKNDKWEYAEDKAE